ncbi:MAG: hypothetical protein US49_C0007G0004 [candidate division TM6 bacterium GW2011_GWF2_37_49]|nr:MAG: hypothetical protein US49_C0007G0004 [candidate division TM6 bacterium GW2011_GWF2_37_49]
MKHGSSLIKLFFIFPFLLLICSCAKDSTDQKNKKLAQNYYKLCMLEFSDKSQTSVSSEEPYKKALQYIQQAIDSYACSEYLAVKATLLFRLNDVASSCKVFEESLKLDCEPQIKACIMNNYACLLAQIGKHEKALDIFKGLETNNAYLTPQAALFNRGKIMFEQADYNAAVQEFLKAIQKSPDFLDARYYLAMSAFRMNDLALAKNEVKTILFLEPGHEGATWLKNKIDADLSIDNGLGEDVSC